MTMEAAIIQSKKPSFALTSRVFIARGMRHNLRDVETLMMALMLPVMLMLLFTYVFGGAFDEGGDYINYVVPGVILLCASFGSMGTAVGIARDMTNGIIARFRTMPISDLSVIVGHVVANVVRNLFATSMVFGVAWLIGFRPLADLSGWLAALGLIAVVIVAFTSLFAALGVLAGSPDAANTAGFIFVFLPYVSSAFVPTHTMPAWLQGVANNQPLTPMIEAIRGLLMGAPTTSDIGWALGWCALITGGALAVGLWAFRRKAGVR